jgi:hypothetical protein
MAPLEEKYRISKGLGPGGFVWAIASSLVVLGVVASTPGVRAEDFPVPGANQSIGPARKSGGGIEFRRKLSSVDNPYCDIRTYVLPDLPEQAS